MATASTVYTGAGGEGWTDESTGLNEVFAINAGAGNPAPCGDFSGAALLPSGLDVDAAHAGLTSDTWETVFGVPAGSVINTAKCPSIDHKCVAGLRAGGSAAFNVDLIDDSGNSILASQLLNLSLPISAGGWNTDTSGGSVAVNGGSQASNSKVRPWIENPVQNGSGGVASPQYQFDNLYIEIDYTPPDSDSIVTMVVPFLVAEKAKTYFEGGEVISTPSGEFFAIAPAVVGPPQLVIPPASRKLPPPDGILYYTKWVPGPEVVPPPPGSDVLGPYSAISIFEQLSRVVLCGYRASAWYVRVGLLLDDGTLQWSDEVDLELDPTPSDKGHLRTRWDGVLEFAWRDTDGELHVTRGRALDLTAVGDWQLGF